MLNNYLLILEKENKTEHPHIMWPTKSLIGLKSEMEKNENKYKRIYDTEKYVKV